MSVDDIEDLAWAEYQSALGKTILVGELYGFVGDDQVLIAFSPPVAVKVLDTPDNCVLRWCCDWLDPYWDVELLDEEHPCLIKGWRASWFEPPSYSPDGDREPTAWYTILE